MSCKVQCDAAARECVGSLLATHVYLHTMALHILADLSVGEYYMYMIRGIYPNLKCRIGDLVKLEDVAVCLSMASQTSNPPPPLPPPFFLTQNVIFIILVGSRVE